MITTINETIDPFRYGQKHTFCVQLRISSGKLLSNLGAIAVLSQKPSIKLEGGGGGGGVKKKKVFRPSGAGELWKRGKDGGEFFFF